MSLKTTVCVMAFCGAFAAALCGVACSGSAGGGAGGSGGAAGSMGAGGTRGSGVTQDSGEASGSGGSMGAPFDAGPPDRGPPKCAPGSLAGFTPAMNPSPRSLGRCTDALIGPIVDACYGGDPDASASACSSLLADPAAKTCYFGCLVTPWTGASPETSYEPAAWGGLLRAYWLYGLTSYTSMDFFDYGGCLAAAAPKDSAAQACAKAYEESQECLLEACIPSCPLPAVPDGENELTDPAWIAAANQQADCLDSAGTSACSKYSDALTSACSGSGLYAPYEATGPVAACNSAIMTFSSSSSTAAQRVAAYRQLFGVVCGSGVVDGGPPPSDAPHGG
jgi:hypothetical protein